MSSHLRAMGRSIMRRHKVLPSKRKRAGIPFRQWTKIILQALEKRAKQTPEPSSVTEQLKNEEAKGE